MRFKVIDIWKFKLCIPLTLTLLLSSCGQLPTDEQTQLRCNKGSGFEAFKSCLKIEYPDGSDAEVLIDHLLSEGFYRTSSAKMNKDFQLFVWQTNELASYGVGTSFLIDSNGNILWSPTTKNIAVDSYQKTQSVSPENDELAKFEKAMILRNSSEYYSEPLAVILRLSATDNPEETLRFKLEKIYFNHINENIYDSRDSFLPKITDNIFDILKTERILTRNVIDGKNSLIEFFDKGYVAKHVQSPNRLKPADLFVSIPAFSYVQSPYVVGSLFRDDNATSCSESRLYKRQPVSYQLRVKPINEIGRKLFKKRNTFIIRECNSNPESTYHGQPRPYESRTVVDFE